MYLLYADESGDTRSRHFVVGGLLVHEQGADPLARRLDAVVANAAGSNNPGTEFHAQAVRTGKGSWRRVPKAQRDAATADALSALRAFRSRQRLVLFAVAAVRADFPSVDIVERAYEELFLRVDSFLGWRHSQGDSHRCVVVSDETRFEPRLQALMGLWRRRPGRVRQLKAFAEVPLFADSSTSRLLQLADFVAHWTYRAYEAGDAAVFHQLVPLFDARDGVRHGLVHLTRTWRRCACAGCASRRSRGDTEAKRS
jgi:hypothetical protein